MKSTVEYIKEIVNIYILETMQSNELSIEEKRLKLKNLNETISKDLGSAINDLDLMEEKEILNNYCNRYKSLVDICDDEYTLEKKHEIDREWQDMFIGKLEELNVDGYGRYMGKWNKDDINSDYLEVFKNGGFENEVFYVREYNMDGIAYSDCSCGLDDKLYELDENGEIEKGYMASDLMGFHSKDCVAWETNFFYKPTGLKICWYKFPLKSAYANHEISKDELEVVLNHCIRSIKK